jgi:hypothetical protein
MLSTIGDVMKSQEQIRPHALMPTMFLRPSGSPVNSRVN